MSKLRRAPRLPNDAHPSVPHDRREVARFLRPQPIAQIPRRYEPTATRGLIALPLLGYRVIRHGH